MSVNENKVNGKYTFGSFVVGDGNRLAYAACVEAAEIKEKYGVPLFIYGDHGIGKTHLLNAIKNRMIEIDESANIIYVSTEDFTNDVIEAIRNNANDMLSIKNLNNKYRTADAILIDDFQDMNGKETTQDMLMHIIDELRQQGKLIVIAADRSPSKIRFCDERLEAWSQSGFDFEILYPDYETRLSILKAKMTEKGVVFSDEVLSYIAERADTNAWTLEGALNKLMIYKSLTKEEITIPIVEKELNNLSGE